MVKKYRNVNKGYSLVEMIIVIAIIALLSVMAMVSITLIHAARAKDASIKLGSEATALKTKCMNMIPSNSSSDFYALALYNDSNGTPHLALVEHDKALDTYSYVSGEDYNLSSTVTVKFKGTFIHVGSTNGTMTTFSGFVLPGSKTGTGSSNSPVIIRFDKRGNCYSGYGEYAFYKRNGNQVARVIITQNGSIEVR